LVGDKAADIEAAKRAGLKGAVIVATGYGAEEYEAAMAQEGGGFTVLTAATLDEARALLEAAF
ncbi:MAG: HAD hydrolase-like protein, partial [Amphiplicatus sp.]